MDALFRYDWPGNVRELRQAVRQAAAFSGGDDRPISALHLLEVVQQRASDSRDERRHAVAFDPATETWKQVHDRARRRYVHGVLAETGGNREAAAKRAGISRSRFFEILRQIEEIEEAP